MKNIELRRAGAQDVGLLVDLRKTVLIAANKLPADADLSHLDAACAAYFADESKHTTFLALDGDQVVGVGSADYHTEMLEATDMGAPLYRKLGFVDAKGYMRLSE